MIETESAWVKFRNKIRRVSGLGTVARLLRETRAYAPILPLLSKQIRDASSDMSKEIESICAEFQDMAGSAKQSVEIVSGLLSNKDEQIHVGGIIQDCRKTMAELLDHMDRGSQLYSQAIAQIETVNESVQRIFSVLQEVEKTSFASKLVALNAKIEAVHLGSLGAGFEVVAEQISQQAARSGELTAEVSEILQGVLQTMANATSESKRIAELDAKQASTSRHSVEHALQNLEAAHAQMETALQKAGVATEKLVTGISGAITSLQFQDRVSQRLEHVVESIDSMASALSTRNTEGEEDKTVAERQREITATMMSSYTMDSERAAHGVETVAAHPSSDEGGDFELF